LFVDDHDHDYDYDHDYDHVDEKAITLLARAVRRRTFAAPSGIIRRDGGEPE